MVKTLLNAGGCFPEMASGQAVPRNDGKVAHAVILYDSMGLLRYARNDGEAVDAVKLYDRMGFPKCFGTKVAVPRNNIQYDSS